MWEREVKRGGKGISPRRTVPGISKMLNKNFFE